MIDPHKSKYFPMYWEMAYVAARQSVATRAQVGAVVVTPTGMISIGYNGMPSGLSNQCEITSVWDEAEQAFRLKTDPRVIHAEQNALDKMKRQGVPTQDCVLFVTLSPCFQCAKGMCGLGLKAIYYDKLHDCTEGLKLLRSLGVPVIQKDTNAHVTEGKHWVGEYPPLKYEKLVTIKET